MEVHRLLADTLAAHDVRGIFRLLGDGNMMYLTSYLEVIYTTNSIESLNYQLRKIIKNRGHFPNDDAVIKLLWLAIRDIEDKRARARAKEKGAPRNQRKAAGHLVEGATVQGWKAALGALALAYPDRLAGRLG
jgi:putative transposase